MNPLAQWDLAEELPFPAIIRPLFQQTGSHKHPPCLFRGSVRGHKWRIHSQGAASQLGLLPRKRSHVQARIPRARRKYVVCLFGVFFLYYEIRLIAWESVDKRSSQQMQEVSEEEREPQQFWGHRASKHQSWGDVKKLLCCLLSQVAQALSYLSGRKWWVFWNQVMVNCCWVQTDQEKVDNWKKIIDKR